MYNNKKICQELNMKKLYMKLTTFCVQVMGQIQAVILQIQTVILEIKIVIIQTLFVILQIQAVSQHIQKQFDVVHFNLLHFPIGLKGL